MTLRHSILQALTEALTNTGIQHIDVWNHNVEFIDQEQAWHRPAVFVEFGDMLWEHVKQGERRTKFSLTLHLVCDYTTSSDIVRQWELAEEVSTAVCNLCSDGDGSSFCISALQSTSTNHNHEDLVEELLTFNVRATVK